jgi:Rrf2 family transcriptional regulator, nitric oxide-sensitive transcriptional repressor
LPVLPITAEVEALADAVFQSGSLPAAARSDGRTANHLVKVVQDLGRSGFLQTQRGLGGGFTLARPPEQIRVGDIVRMGEETDTVIECVDKPDRSCRLAPACRLKGALDEAAATLPTLTTSSGERDVAKPAATPC